MSHFSKKTFEGKTLEEAIEKAERELGLPKDRFIYDILRESNGILGFGQKVVIEVSPRPVDLEEDISKEVTLKKKEINGPPSNGNVPQRLTEFFKGILDRLNESGKIEITEEEKKIVVRAALNEGSIFLNKKGHTIDSIKYLLNLVAIREGSGGKRISIFIAEKPSDTNIDLVEMAKEVKEKVERHHKTIVVGGMDSKARKVFHSVIGKDPNVTTYSDGEGVQRKLYIERKTRKPIRQRKVYSKIRKSNRGGRKNG
ncbi:MAG: Jag N-terminal domain-containing protein [Deltaproteobacteria bacterium]|nr:Jag N-terminal domain-containing protein [Deltaproteobacteria bacterium]